jgi:nucleotide-binding universal stress UspA family protein
MYRKIVVGTDGSDTSLGAVRRAAELAAEVRAELRVVVVYEPGHGTELAPLIARGGRTTELLDAVRAYSSQHGAEPEFHLLSGDPADQVVALATDTGADLVVVGSKGMGGMKDSLKGSVPTRITRSAPCDVLVVRTA